MAETCARTYKQDGLMTNRRQDRDGREESAAGCMSPEGADELWALTLLLDTGRVRVASCRMLLAPRTLI